MAFWLISALTLLRGLGGRLLGGAAAPLAVAGGVAAESAGIIDVIPGFGASGRGGFLGTGLGAGGGQRVRRRKKALTNTDLATMALISSVVSKKAAENFVLMRVRR